VFLVEGGVPHAIGSGCLLIEIQEPTDYTLRVERTTPRGMVLADQACHQGLGFEKMMECFHYETYGQEETLKKWKKEPKIVREQDGGREQVLIDSSHTDRFRMNLLEVSKQLPVESIDTFSIAIVTSGTGSIMYEGKEINISQSDEIFLPAALSSINFKNTCKEELKVILCYPPN
jgi:mannose-6-phosphate isomerase